MRVSDLRVPEPAQAQLDHGPVVQDLRGGIGVCDGVLQVRHQHQVPGLEPVVVDGVMVDVAQDGLGPQPIRGVLGVDVLAQTVNDLQAGLLLGLGFTL